MNIIILGQQGSGKGTQAEFLAEKLGLFYFETGKFLRNLAKNDPYIDEFVNKKGILVPEGILFEKIKEYFAEKNVDINNVLYDGFPRNIKQYKLFESWLENSKIDLVIFLKISDEETIKRLSSRRICKKCGETFNTITNPEKEEHRKACGGELIQREDDTPEAISKRLEVYRSETKPLLQVLSQKGIVKEVDGSVSIPEVQKNIEAIL